MKDMDNTTRFNTYVNSLRQFAAREGHCNVPAIHIEIYNDIDVTLGAWVGYVRQRYRKNQLSVERTAQLQAVPGWQWGPLKPGPATDNNRNLEIHEMRAAGHSLRQIADKFDLSRQRVHQIVKNPGI
jgi:hypothetical protein